MKSHRILALAALGLISLSASSSGTTLGYDTQFESYAFWDLVNPIPSGADPAGTFSGLASDVSSLGLLNITISQTRTMVGSGAGNFGNDGVYTSTDGSDWVIEGVSVFAATTLTLQIKFNKPAYGANQSTYFEPLLTIGGQVVSPTSAPSVLDPNEKVNNLSVYVLTWNFENLDLAAGTQFRFDVSGGANGHVFVDGVSVGVNPIPEPSTWAAMAGGASMLIGSQLLRRRRKERYQSSDL